jgi:hypothetical protein
MLVAKRDNDFVAWCQTCPCTCREYEQQQFNLQNIYIFIGATKLFQAMGSLLVAKLFGNFLVYYIPTLLKLNNFRKRI